MASKPETRMTSRIHRIMRNDYPEVYFEKTNNPFRSGIPDFYYEAPKGKHLWVEYKWYETIPKNPFHLLAGKNPKISPLQWKWLDRAYVNDQPVRVVVGFGSPVHTFLMLHMEQVLHTITREDITKMAIHNVQSMAHHIAVALSVHR